MDLVQLSSSSLGWSCSFSLLFSRSILFYAWILVWVLSNLSFIYNFSASFWIICFCCRSSGFAINSATFTFSSISLFFIELISPDILELLDSSESLDSFEFIILLVDTFLWFLDEQLDELALWAASLSQRCTSSWRNILECQRQLTNHYLYLFHHLSKLIVFFINIWQHLKEVIELLHFFLHSNYVLTGK